MTFCVQVTELAGYTSRVWEMFDVFEDVSRGIYRRSADREEEPAERRGAQVLQGQRICGPLEIRGELQVLLPVPSIMEPFPGFYQELQRKI